MKKLLMIAFVAMATVFCFTSCSKEKDLKGTTWHATFSTTMDFEDSGMTFVIDLAVDATLNFTDETNGNMVLAMNASMAGTSLYNDTDTQAFTYTFDGEKGTMTAEGETTEFTYNKDENTIIMSEKDDETGETFELVFSEK